MNRVEDLSALLHAATPEPPADVPFDQLVRRFRRRRRVAATGAGLAIAATAAVSTMAMARHYAPETVSTTMDVAVPGVYEREHARLFPQCDPREHAPADLRHELDATPLRLYNRIDAPGGFYALFYNKTTSILCGKDSRPADGGGLGYGGVENGSSEWLAGDVTLDQAAVTRKGVTVVDGTNTRPPRMFLQVAAGRVSGRVAKVVLTGPDGSSATVTPVNGTYIAVIYIENASDSTLAGPNGTNELAGSVEVFDANGQRLATRTNLSRLGCYVKPDGTTLHSGKKPRAEEGPCIPAARWKP